MSQILKVALILAGLLILALGGSELLFNQGTSGAGARIESVTGKVEVRDAGGGIFKPVVGGEALGEKSVLRTSDEGRAKVSIGEANSLVLEAGSELEVKTLTADRSVLQLRYGQLQADMTQFRDNVLEVEGANPELRVRTRGGRVTVSSDGFNGLGVQATSGEAELVRGDEVLETFAAGEGGAIGATGEATRWEAKTREMLLKVAWPPGAALGEEVVVRGEAQLGSEVRVAGTRVPVGADGHFEASVPLPEAGRVEVQARSPLGTKRAESPNLLATPTPTVTPSPSPTPQKPPQINVQHDGRWD